jgi:hypothetical protein
MLSIKALLDPSNSDSVCSPSEREVWVMMGRRRRDQAKLFYEFRLDDRIPNKHLLRRIDVLVTEALADLREELEPYYSDIGRPSVDPSS